MMKKALWMAVIFGMVAFAGSVQAQPISLEFVPASQTVGIGDPVTVAIKISGLGNGAAPSLSTFDLDVNFDPVILSCTSATFGDSTLGDQLDLSGFGTIAAVTPGVGIVNLFELSFDLPNDLDIFQAEAFILAEITCDTLALGTSPLTMTVNAVGDALGDPLSADVSDGSVTVTSVAVVDLATILGNSGFESGLAQWTATKKNKNYRLDAPVVNPVIIPKGKTSPLEAPVGNNFIGILNPQDADINGRLVHVAVAQFFPAGTVFQVTVWANRGRLQAASSPDFTSQPSEVTVQFFGWGAGSTPVVNPSTDNWSRRLSVNILKSFTNWAVNSEWASQTFEFETTQDLHYISLALTGKNHIKASYVAFDID